MNGSVKRQRIRAIAALVFGWSVATSAVVGPRAAAIERAPEAADSRSGAQAVDSRSEVAFAGSTVTLEVVDQVGTTRVVAFDPATLHEARSTRGRLRVRNFPASEAGAVDLELEAFRVTGPQSRFVLGSAGGADRTLAFDPSRVALFRGAIPGQAGSHVFLALGPRTVAGHVDLGPGRSRRLISSRGPAGDTLPAGRLSIFDPRGGATGFPAVPECGLDRLADAPVSTSAPGRFVRSPAAGAGPAAGIRRLELAVDTDHEFYQLFPDGTAAAEYLVMLYGAVSDIYLRDTDIRIELVYARLWDDPDDLFNVTVPSPLPGFRDHWLANMDHVHRDLAQLLSGRRDYPFGGQAWVSALCDTFGFSVAGYAIGRFPDPTKPSPLHYDVAVTAHEIGHNAGTGHTHDFANQVDTCNEVVAPESKPQRGTIMSYCGQSWSGQNGNRDLYFHSVIQANIEGYVAGVACVDFDCNGNGIADELDLAVDGVDANGDLILDECQDCDEDGLLDPDAIAMGEADLDLNGIPDSCEPDCNGNGVPDRRDIALGSVDFYGNDVPDECEADCNANGTSDYTEIQSDMTLDRDRNAVLDACQDCDGDGTIDREALAGAHDLWIASGLTGSVVREFHGVAGVLLDASDPAAPIDRGQDVIVSPAGTVWVSSAGDHRVLEFDRSGLYLGDFIPSGSGGLDEPAGMHVTGDRLLIASRGIDAVLAYDAATGASLGPFVLPASGGLVEPFGITTRPGGNLVVTSSAGEILEYDGETGEFVRVLVSAAANGGLDRPRGLTFKPDGNLLVASYGSDEVLEYDGATGAPLGKWAQVGTATRLTQDSPWGIRIGPNGNVFVGRTGTEYRGSLGSDDDHDHDHDEGEDAADNGHWHGTKKKIVDLHLTNAQIYEFDVANGNFVRTYLGGNDHGLLFPTGFDFVPGWQIDCNANATPDACDIAAGSSLDLDASLVPDECETDCNGNQILDRLDLIPFGTEADCDGNLVPDSCQTDCDGDGIADVCQVAPGETAEVAGLRVDPGTTPDVTTVTWDAFPPGTAYDLVTGRLSDLHAAGSVSGAVCGASALSEAAWDDPRILSPGTGVYYLVRVAEPCSVGSYGQGSGGVERLPTDDCNVVARLLRHP